MGVETDIRKAVNDRLIANGYTDVAWPNVSYDGNKPYYRISFLPAPTQSWTFGGRDIRTGIIQIDVVIVDDVGEIAAVGLAEGILALFTRTLYIDEGTTQIGFTESGWLGPAVYEEGGYFLPVTIPYITTS